MSKVVKPPVIMQMEALECGAASLAMIMAYYGKWVPLEKVRSDCGVSRDGSSVSYIIRAAENYGLEVNAYRCDLEGVKKLTLPVMIHWNFNHFVVLDGFTRGKAVLNDPARGCVTVSMSEFDKAFTGVAVEFKPTEKFVRDGHKKSVLSFVKTRLKGTAMPFAFVVLTGLIASFMTIVNNIMSQTYVDKILAKQNLNILYPFLAGMIAILIIQIMVDLIQTVYMLKVRGKFAVVASSSFIWHVLRLPIEFFSQRFAGDIVERQDSNEGIAEALIHQIAPILLNMVFIVLYLVFMLNYSVPLTLVALASIAINLLTSRYISNQRINVSRANVRDSGMLASTTTSGIEMIETIKAAGAENGYFERWAGYNAKVMDANQKLTQLGVYIGSVPGLVNQICTTMILILGVVLIIKGQFSQGMLLAFQGFANSMLSPVQSMISVGQSIQEMRTSMERIEDVMENETDVNYSDEALPEDVGKLGGEVELRDVTFGYNKLAAPLIEHFSLHIKPGGKVAIVGSSGCGKSTVTKLVSGLYKPWSGDILFDGKPADSIRHEVKTASLAVVDQDITLFNDTIADNIRMWDSSIENFEIILAARDAQIHNDILERKDGYSSMIEQDGANFSGGQRQRFEIARVLAQDPTILILDEATSALDAVTEYNVTHAIEDRGITCIIVAHRLSTIRDCDEIIVLDHGHVVERGTHEELYKKGGYYTKLVSTE